MNKIFNVKGFEKVIKSRFIYDQSFAIYGKSSGLFDIGPIGCAIQNNIVSQWRKHFILKDQMNEVDCSILTPEIVLKNSGHLSKFSDLMVRDEVTNETFRVDHLLTEQLAKRLKKNKSSRELNDLIKKLENSELSNLKEIDDLIEKFNIKAPNTGNKLSMAKEFNLMFQTQMGSTAQTKSYLRPETTQGIFLNFKRLFKQNPHLPLKVAQIGKAFRNEISPKGGLIRQREFLMAEIGHFLHPSLKFEKYEPFDVKMQNIEVNILSNEMQAKNGDNTTKMSLRLAVKDKIINNETVAYYLGRIHQFAVKCGIDRERIRFRQHMNTELAHYASECWDLECHTSHGWIECAGIADRCDYDLKQHAESGENFSIQKLENVDAVVSKIRTRFLDTNLLTESETDQFLEIFYGEQARKDIINFIQTDTIKELKIQLDNIKVLTMGRKDLMRILNETSVVFPHVIEPSFGIGRFMYTILEHNFKARPDNRHYFSFPYNISPYKCCILPLNDTDKSYEPIIKKISELLTEAEVSHLVDARSGSIGKRYSRADEIGIKYAITLDYVTLEKSETITLRDRDSMGQIRVKIDDIVWVLENLAQGKLKFDEE